MTQRRRRPLDCGPVEGLPRCLCGGALRATFQPDRVVVWCQDTGDDIGACWTLEQAGDLIAEFAAVLA